MTKLQKIEQALEQAIKDRDASEIGFEWRTARNTVEDLTQRVQRIKAQNAPKPTMPAWQVAQLDMNWDED